jgi:hypothetical protein
MHTVIRTRHTMATKIVSEFVQALKSDTNLTNHLRVIISTDAGANDLKRELNIKTPEQIATNKALTGNTVDLFPTDMVREFAPAYARLQATRLMVAMADDRR